MAWTTATDRILVFECEMWGREPLTERVIQDNDHEFYIVLHLQARDINHDLSDLDVSGASSSTLVMVDPDGDIKRFTMANRSGGTDGLVQYQIADGEINKPGMWQLYGEVAFTTSKVTSNRNTLFVEGELDGRLIVAPEKKKDDVRFSVTSHDVSAATGDFIAYIKNDRTEHFVIDEITVSAVNTALWKAFYVTGTASGTSLTPTNLTSDSNEAARLTAFGNGAVASLSAGSQLGAVRTPAADTKSFSIDNDVRLGPADALAIEYDTGTTGVAEVVILGHFE